MMRQAGKCRHLARCESPQPSVICAALDARASSRAPPHGWACSTSDATSMRGQCTRQPCTPSTSYHQTPWAAPSGWHMTHGRHHYSSVAACAAARPGGDPSRPASGSQQVSASVQVVQQQQPPQQQAQAPQGERPPVRYSPLHYNVEDFCQRITPTEDEIKYKQQVIEAIRTQARKAMLEAGRRCEVQVFGSFATGLSTWSSDVDLVVTGIMEPDRHTGVYDINERGRVVGRLRRIGEALRRCKKLDSPRISIIPRARIPIIKLKVRNVHVDISMSDDTGTRCARYMAQQVRAYPPMRPLVLVLKAYLRAVGLNEVMHGGLSSYSLCNMVVAHLQEERKAGRDIYDLGEVLYAFLLRYGEEYDYGRDAVSIESGGIVKKVALGIASDVGRSAYGSHELDRYFERLAVDCPVTGRDVSNGTYRIDAVRGAFQRAARRLEALARGRKVDDLSLNYLQALFDVNRVLKRTNNDTEYEDDFIRVLGKGTSPEIIQLDRGRGEDYDEEEMLSDDLDSDSLGSTSGGDMWGASDDEGLPPQPTEGRRSRGGPRGKGVK